MTDDKRRVSTRLRGRELAFRIENDSVDSFARMGAVRIRVAPDGKAT